LPGADDSEIPAYLRQFQMIDARAAGTADVVAKILDRIANLGDQITAKGTGLVS
jgi:hypothetical protein